MLVGGGGGGIGGGGGGGGEEGYVPTQSYVSGNITFYNNYHNTFSIIFIGEDRKNQVKAEREKQREKENAERERQVL